MVYGCEVWTFKEADKERYIGGREVVMVDIDEARAQSRDEEASPDGD